MSEKLRVLIVDDKKIIGDLFDFTLGYNGHHIVWVASAPEALAALDKEKFDVVFLDIVMPEQDGIALLETIRSKEANLPVIIMSGYSVEDKRNKAKEFGVYSFLKKPFEMDDVRVAVKQALGKEI